MKANFTTTVTHTINFYSSPDLACRGYLGLRDLFFAHLPTTGGSFEVLDAEYKLQLSFKDVMPSALDEMDLRMLESFCEGEDDKKISKNDLRMIIQYLVNKEVLPSGDFTVTFKEFR